LGSFLENGTACKGYFGKAVSSLKTSLKFNRSSHN